MNEGIDVSEFQPDVSWRQIAGAVEFAFIRATYGSESADGAFSKGRVAEAQKEMPFVGFYHFAYPDHGDANVEAEHFVKTVRDRGGKLGVAKLDGHNLATGVLDYETLRSGGGDNAWVGRWVDTYTHLVGQKPLIYGGSALREANIETHGCELWLAAYVKDPEPFVPANWHKQGWRLWQYTEAGTCPGVPGHVDRSKFRKD